MKRKIKILLIVLVSFIVLLAVLPMLFSGTIIEKVKEEVNNQVNAEVDFGDFSLSLISSFPDFRLKISDVSVINKAPFEGDTLFHTDKILLDLDLMSVISGENFSINKIALDHPVINVLINAQGIANYDIAKESETSEETPTTEETPSESSFSLNLDHYEINHAKIVYDDQLYNTYVAIKDLTHQGDGDLSADVLDLNTLTDIQAFTFEYEGVNYMKALPIHLDMVLGMDMANFKYTLKENLLKLGDLALGIDGFVSMPAEDIEMDLNFSTNQTDFKHLFSLVPGVYQSDISDIDLTGTFDFGLVLKGIYNEVSMPSYSLNLKVEDGKVQYPDLPQSIHDIHLDLKVDNPTGKEDDLKLDLKKLYALLGDYVIDANAYFEKPISNPMVKFDIQSQIDLSHLKDFIPIENGESYQGNITANLHGKGYLNDLEKEMYDRFEANGDLNLLDFKYTSNDLNYPVEISSTYMQFTPQNFRLKSLEGKIGNSDFSAKGKMDNILSYVLLDETLKGEFNYASKVFDLNDWMSEDEDSETAEESTVTGSEVEEEVFEVLGNVDFKLNATIDQLLYEDIAITNVASFIHVKDHKFDFRKATMNMLKGSLSMNGYYATPKAGKPNAGFFLKVNQWDIAETFKTFNTVQKIAPAAKYLRGRFTTEMSIAGNLLPNYEFDLSTIGGKGHLSTKEVKVVNSPTFNKIADLMKYDKLKQASFKDVELDFVFKDGKMVIKPFETKILGSKAKINGENRFDQTVKYDIEYAVPTAAFGGKANEVANDFAKKLNSLTGASVTAPNELKFDIAVEGPYNNPNVKVVPAGVKSAPKIAVKEVIDQVKDEVKQTITETIDKTKEDVIKKAEQEAKRLIDEAEKKGNQLVATAKREADKLRQEGEKQAKAVEDKARNPLEKVAAKKAADAIRKKANNSADQVVKTAENKKRDLINTARNKGNQLINEAKKK